MGNGKRAAITGGIGEGKSTALSILARAGCRCASADEVAKEVLGEEEVRKRIAHLAQLADDFSNRELRERIIESEILRQKVNQITHPLIMERMLALNCHVYEVPLLFEEHLERHFDETWVIYCSDEEKERRLARRYGGAKGAELQNTQWPRDRKIALADFALSSELPFKEFEGQLLARAHQLFGDACLP